MKAILPAMEMFACLNGFSVVGRANLVTIVSDLGEL
jgi:hypothetical protein